MLFRSNFLRLPEPLSILPGFSETLSTVLPQIQSLFAIDLMEPEVELYVHAYNDGTHFDRHADTHGGGNWRRRISCVYYVHRQPRGFDGGDLVIYDRRGSAHAIRAEHNSAVFFPAYLLHEVARVTCPSRAFAGQPLLNQRVDYVRHGRELAQPHCMLDKAMFQRQRYGTVSQYQKFPLRSRCGADASRTD